MQATMLGYDAATGHGSCVTDDGLRLEVMPGSLDGSGLRFVRAGQRVTVTTATDDSGTVRVATVRIVGVVP